jgi:hypothetical protein
MIPTLVDAICADLMASIPRQDAAQRAGLEWRIFAKWMHLGQQAARAGEQDCYSAFRQRILAAEAENGARLVRVIHNAIVVGADPWLALAMLRSHPRHRRIWSPQARRARPAPPAPLVSDNGHVDLTQARQEALAAIGGALLRVKQRIQDGEL